MKQLLAVPKDDVESILPFVAKYVKPAYDTGIGEQKWSTLLGRAFLGDVVFWLAFNEGKVVGMASTEIINFDGYRCVHLITSATEIGDGFWDYHYALEDYARAVGARNLQFWGRKGWSKAIDKVTGTKNEKYKEVYRVFSMEIEYDNENPPEPSSEASE